MSLLPQPEVPRSVVGQDPLPLRIGNARLASTIIAPPPAPRIGTGIEALDAILDGGLAAGNLATLLAGTAGGKSRILTISALTAVLHGHVALYASAELAPEEIVKIIATAGVDLTSTMPLYILGTNKLGDITTHARDLAQRLEGAPPMLVCVDYLQLIRPGGEYDRREMEVSTVAMALATLSRATGAAVLAAAQMNRAGRALGSAAESLHARESAMIEQASDSVVTLYDAKDEKLGMKVVKSRWGAAQRAVTVKPDWKALSFQTVDAYDGHTGGTVMRRDAGAKPPAPTREQKLLALREKVAQTVGSIFMRKQVPATAADVAGELGLTPASARDHLTALAAIGRIVGVPVDDPRGLTYPKIRGYVIERPLL